MEPGGIGGIAIAIVGLGCIFALILAMLAAQKRAMLDVWGRLAAARGASVVYHFLSLKLNGPLLTYEERTPAGTVRLGPRKGGGGSGVAYGETIARIEVPPGATAPPFLLGDIAWAGVWAPWAARLPPCPGLGPELPHPLDKGVCELAHLQWWNARARELAVTLEIYLAYGIGREITVHMQGGLETPADYPRFEALIELLQAIALSAAALHPGHRPSSRPPFARAPAAG